MRTFYTKAPQTRVLLHKTKKGDVVLLDWAGYQGPAIVTDACTPALSSLRGVFLINVTEARTVPMDLEVELVEAELHITIPNTAIFPTIGMGESSRDKKEYPRKFEAHVPGTTLKVGVEPTVRAPHEEQAHCGCDALWQDRRKE